ncbi:hypothetical protein BLSTO_05139 [Blastocystis sp. subtype 1]
MAEGKNPFEGCNQMQLMKKLMTESPSLSGEGWSAECVDFVGKCVVRSVEERWTVSHLMEHPFVKESVERIRREGVSPVLVQWVGVKENTIEGNCEEKEENKTQNEWEEKENTTQNECEEKENTTHNEWEEKEENATQNKGKEEETIPPMEELPENGIVSCITVQSCADYRSEVLDFSRFANLEVLRIEKECFDYPSKLKIEGLKKLKGVEIASGCFHCTNADSEVIIRNCPELAELVIGDHSFPSFKSLRMSGLPSLQRIQMGAECFREVSLEVKTMESLEVLVLGEGCFEKSLHTVIEDCPKLKCVLLQQGALRGVKSDVCSVLLRNLPLLEGLECERGCFENARMRVENCPKLRTSKTPVGDKKGVCCLRNWEGFVPILLVCLFVGMVALLVVMSNYSNEREKRQTVEDLIECLNDTSISANVDELIITGGHCNENITTIHFGGFKKLKNLTIEENSLMGVDVVKLDGLKELERVVIGENTFTRENGSFVLKGCSSLRELRIGDNAFERFTKLELKKLPMLEEVEIGRNCFGEVDALNWKGMKKVESVKIGEGSFGAKSGSFSVQQFQNLIELEIGNDAFANFDHFSLSDVPQLSSVSIGNNCFQNVNKVEFIGLEKLESVTIQRGSFLGNENATVSSMHLKPMGVMIVNGLFVVRNCPFLKTMAVDDDSFSHYKVCEIENVQELESIAIGRNCFSSADLKLKGK